MTFLPPFLQQALTGTLFDGSKFQMGGGGAQPFQQIRAPLPLQQPQLQPMAQEPIAPMPKPGPFAGLGLFAQRMGEQAMPTPEGMGDMVGQDALSAARRQGLLSFGLALLGDSGTYARGTAPSLGQSLAKGMGAMQQGFQGNLMQGIQGQQMAQQAAQQQQASAALQQVMQKYGDPTKLSDAQMSRMLREVTSVAAATGNFELLGRLGAFSQMMGGERGAEPKWEDFGGEKRLMDAQGNVLKVEKKTPSPRDPNAPDTAAQMRDQRMFTREQQLGDDFRQETKPFATVADNVGVIRSVVPAARAQDAAAQMALIFSYMKLLDPGSTVREGEYATAQNATGIPEQTRNQYNRVMQGARLAPEQVDRFAKQADAVADSWQRRLKPIRERYQRRAKAWGVDASGIVSDYFAEILGAGSATKGKSTGNPLLEP